MGTTPVVIRVRPFRNGGGSAAVGTGAAGSDAGEHPAAIAPAPSALVERKRRRVIGTENLRANVTRSYFAT
jgi:hypothetical protein